MKVAYFSILFSLFVFTTSSLQTFYVSNASSCATNNCDGSQSNPFPGLIFGFFSAMQQASLKNDFSISIELVSDLFVLKDSQLSFMAGNSLVTNYNGTYQLFERNISINVTKAFDFIRIKPAACDQDPTVPCSSHTVINMKTENISFTVAQTTIIRNLIFQGQNLIYRHQGIINPTRASTIDKSCLESDSIDCCTVSKMSDNSSNCYIVGLDASQRQYERKQDYQYGLFQHKHDYTSLNVSDCQFILIIGIGATSVDTYNYLFGTFIDPFVKFNSKNQVVKNLVGLSFSLTNSRFSGNYMFFGEIYYTNNNQNQTTIIVKNCSFEDHNAFAIKDQTSYYNDFVLIISNATNILFTGNTMKNCFKAMYLDYSNTLLMANNSFIYNNDLQIQNVLIITKNINIINGDNSSVFTVNNNSILILLHNPNSEALFQAKDNNTLIMNDQTLSNFSGCSLISFRYRNTVLMQNIFLTQTIFQSSAGLIIFNFDSMLTITNCSISNLDISAGDMIFFSNSSIVTLNNLEISNNTIRSTGSFLRCDVWNCTVTMNNATFSNMTTNAAPAIFFLESACVISVNNSNFLSITTKSQGGLLYGDVWHSLFLMNLIIDSVFAQEGAILYIKDNNILQVTNVTTNNCSANIAFLYYGRESSNTLSFLQSTFSNSQGTAMAQLNGGSIHVQFCVFNNLTNSGQQAAAVYTGTITNMNFNQNFIANMVFDRLGWGVIFLQNGQNNITDCIFTNISAVDGNLGAILYVAVSNTLIVRNVSLTNFASNNQGSIFFESSNVATITNCSFVNVTSYTDGGVLYLGSSNTVYFTNNFVFNVSVNFFGAFASLQDSNVLTISWNNISSLVSKSKGGLIYATSSNTIYVLNMNVSNLISEAGPLVALNSKNTVFINNTNVSNCTAMRYGGLAYSFTLNQIYLFNSSFLYFNSENLAGGFYLDIFNTLVIQNSTFITFSAIESGAIFVTIYENTISMNGSFFQSIWINSSNDGVIARLGLSTALIISNCTFDDLSSQFENVAFFLTDLNSFTVFNTNFTNLTLGSSSGFLQAGTRNTMNFQNVSIDFVKTDQSKSNSGSGSLFMLLNNNIISNFKNINLKVSYFAVLFDFEANGYGNLQKINVSKDSRFDSFFQIRNNSKLEIAYLKLNITTQTISIQDSSLSMARVTALFQSTNFISFISISNSQLSLKNCDFQVNDSSKSSGAFLTAQKGSIVTISRSSFIGFRGSSQSGAGVFQATDCDQFKITSSLLMFNQAGTSGGFLGYQTTGDSAYALQQQQQQQQQQQRMLQGKNSTDPQYAKQLLKILNTVAMGNLAKGGNGGGVFIENDNFKQVDMKVWLFRNRFTLNKANQGGAVFVDNVHVLKVNNTEFYYNKALISLAQQNAGIRAQGGAIFFNGIANNATFTDIDTTYYANKAQIGGGVYLSPLTLTYNSLDSSFVSNSMLYYGQNIAGPVYRISFPPVDMNSSIYNSSILSSSVSHIQSGNEYSSCLAKIIGIDKYNNIALNTIENFAQQVNFTEVKSQSTAKIDISTDEGAICLSRFVKTGLPISGNTAFTVSFQRYDGKTDQLNLALSFRDCQIGEKLTPDFQCQTCPNGTYSLVKNFAYIIDNCKDCSGLDFNCQDGGIYTPKEGFWRYSNLSSSFLSCPKSLNCLGGDLVYNDSNPNDNILKIFGDNPQFGAEAISEVGYCQVGYKGILCNECDSGYGKVNAYTCLPCKSDGYVAWVVFQILFKLIILFASLHISLKTSIGLYMEDISELDVTLTNLIKIMLNHIQMLIVLFTFIDFSQIYNNIISFVLGVNTNLGESFNVECLLKTGGWDLSPLYFEFWITVLYLFPICFVCFFYVRMIHRMSEKKYNKTMSFWLLYLSCILIVLQLSYFDIINVTLKLFPCFNVSDNYDPENRLVFDYSIGCDDRNQIIVKYAAGLPIVLLFGLGFPLILLAILKRKQKNETLHNDESLLAFGFFFYIYEESFFFWDILQLLRKFSMTLIQILLASSLLVQSFASLEVLLIVVFAFLCLQLKLRPYLKPTFDIVNKLERTSLVALAFTFYFALYHTGLELDQQPLFNADLTLFLLSLLINIFFLVYWSYIFLPQQLLSTWYKLRGFGRSIFGICKKKKENGMNGSNRNKSQEMISEHDQNNTKIPKSTSLIEPHSLTVLNLEGPSENDMKSQRTLKLHIDRGETTSVAGQSESSFGDRKSLGSNDRKSIIFLKNLKKENNNSFIPIQQFSFPSIPDLEEETNDLGFISQLNHKQIQGVLLKKSFTEFDEQRRKGLKPTLTDLETFNKSNFSNMRVKLSILSNDGKIYSDDHCEISFKSSQFARNSNFLRFEFIILRKKPEFSIDEIKIKMSSQNSCK